MLDVDALPIDSVLIDGDTHYSTYREALVEHLFAGAVMSHVWLRGFQRVEMLTSRVDDAGYDLLLEANGVIRHIQLKSSTRAAPSRVLINKALAEKPSGCVLWMHVDPATLVLGPFFWFGGEPRKPLPDIEGFEIGKHTRRDATGSRAQRENIRVIKRRDFTELSSIEEVAAYLFG
jgi:hypothetical protein